MTPPAQPEDLIGVAKIARPQGIRGEVIAELLTDFPDRFKKLEEACVRFANGETRQLKLERSWPHKGRIVLKFAGFDDIDQAEKLRNALVAVPREQLVKLPSDSFYDFDLIGCEVSTIDGAVIGRVKKVQDFGAAPLLVVENDENNEKREFLIPMALSICIEIDTRGKRIVINPPEGLLDL